MNLFNSKKWIITFFAVIFILVMWFISTSNQATNSIALFVEKDMTTVEIHRHGFGESERYEITDIDRVNEIKEKIFSIDRHISPIMLLRGINYSISSKHFITGKERQMYLITMSDDSTPENYAYINIIGRNYINLHIYNYEKNRLEDYLFKVEWDIEIIEDIFQK